MKTLTLYPRLVPNIELDFLGQSDMDLLERLSQAPAVRNDGTVEAVMHPKVFKTGAGGFLIEDTGCDFAQEFRELILQKWEQEGAGEELLGVLVAAHRQNCKQILFSLSGMWPEPRKPTKLAKLGKKFPKKKTVKRALEALCLMHSDLWPIEQLANTLNPCLKETRRKK